ncbi:hypothetical protein P7H71_04695 [Lactococcus lactis]|uniref:RelA/SpoT domain-containing protein n=1 Tax=Lactococcus lactis TaxID=1358 RepID=A0AAP5UDT4_9LACT|nr:hypothetical protein [Lactococcus lactis]MDT2859202.1 hypothetical protein [Lactococcus lactis]MDT2861420.1 hypothetical protein [Lactococcus lactis]MDT2867404.1 hypothetical protein [Lactococcus lactis]MDT2870568.1 hypothetical protein [Lactococcus lactis]MDT2872142.1 hypothetical protein [Lactococcus lactis]
MDQDIDSCLEVIKIVYEINAIHKKFSLDRADFLNKNLTKTVRSVVGAAGINNDFLLQINKYKSELNANFISFSEIQSSVPIRYRIKQSESINEKLLYYMSEAHLFGKVPLNKCLNDFLGFRILVDDLDVIYNSLETNDDLKTIVKMYLREDGEYKGLHIYFKNGNNRFFPWELQIWDINQSVQNESSHQKHKQKRKYILLPQNYHDGNLEKEE